VLVIALNFYEKNSFFRFFLIYILTLVLLFSAIASLYLYKEQNRYFQEQKLKNKLEFLECNRFQKLLHNSKVCVMEPIVLDDKMKIIFKEIFIAFLFSLLFIIPFSYFLTRISLKPMKDSVMIMDSFINGIVHDINTPLSVVKMNAQSVAKQIDNQKLKEKSLRIIKGVEQIESLEEQLLFSLKIGQYKLKYEKFDLANILANRKDYWNDIRPNIKVNVKLESTLINADKVAMLRAIDNIVNNAIKYSESKKEVNVILSNSKLEIIDNGIGIKKPKEIFSKYYRESIDTKGVGIGLYIVAQILKLHSIKIDVTSKIGKGSKFCIDLTNITTTL